MSKKTPLETVATLDLTRYAGKWYEIARLPTRFEAQCASDITATYSLRPDGEVEVVNECRTEEGAQQRAEGTARLADPEGPASRLQVSFTAPWLHFLPFVWADYWVIDLDPDYRYAAVGEPGREYLWILARTPELDQAIYERILGRVASQGYDVSGLIHTTHSVVSVT